MVSVSHETVDETRTRLRRVLGLAEMVVLPGTWSFVESPRDRPPVLDEHLLAVVRDEQTWSALRPSAEQDGGERFGVFSFHFPDGVDNSGFVGWLAGALKEELGTGVLVVCGSNRDRGGVYDYWGCPHELLQQAVATVQRLAVV
jgi:hypothetical protein